MLIDIHTHAFHPKIASKAVRHLNKTYSLTCEGTGMLEDLEREEKQAGIDRYTVLCAATTSSQVIPANNYAIAIHNHPGINAIAFGTLHPAYEEWEEELDRLEKHGIRGLKLHPDFQGFSLRDPRLLPFFEACEGRFVILFHIGSLTLLPELAPSSPDALKTILDMFPRLDVIAGHFGGYRMWDLAYQLFRNRHYDHLWLDTSSTSAYVDGVTLRKLLTIAPKDHYFFGTDWPVYSPVEEKKRMLEETGLSETELKQLMSNAAPLLASYGMLPTKAACRDIDKDCTQR